VSNGRVRWYKIPSCLVTHTFIKFIDNHFFLFFVTFFCYVGDAFASGNVRPTVLRILCTVVRERLLLDQVYFVNFFFLFHDVLRVSNTVSVWIWLLPIFQWRLHRFPAVNVCRTNITHESPSWLPASGLFCPDWFSVHFLLQY